MSIPLLSAPDARPSPLPLRRCLLPSRTTSITGRSDRPGDRDAPPPPVVFYLLRVGTVRARNRAPDRQHTISGDRDLGDRVADVHHQRLSALRCAARCAPDQTPSGAVLCRSWSGPSRSSTKNTWAAALRNTFFLAAKLLAQGQTNFVRMLWKFNQVYNLDRQFADHQKAVRYKMPAPRLAPKGGSTGSRCTSTAR
jgi:hypothetical protein